MEVNSVCKRLCTPESPTEPPEQPASKRVHTGEPALSQAEENCFVNSATAKAVSSPSKFVQNTSLQASPFVLSALDVQTKGKISASDVPIQRGLDVSKAMPSSFSSSSVCTGIQECTSAPSKTERDSLSNNLAEPEIIRLLLALLQKKGQQVATLFENRINNGQGAFLKDQLIEARLLATALQQWQGSPSKGIAIGIRKNGSLQGAAQGFAQDCGSSEPPHGTSNGTSSFQSSTESELRLTYEQWKHCDRLVASGIVQDQVSAARAIMDAEGDLDLAASILLSAQ